VQLEANLPKFQAKNAQVIALAVQSQDRAKVSAQAAQATYPFLADPDHQVADAYTVYNLLGDGVATPSVFIINKTGQIVWSYISQDANDRPSSDTILANLP